MSIESFRELIKSAVPYEPQKEEKVEEISTPDPWPIMAEEAYHGLAGEIVRAIEPHSEGDPVAILIQFLLAFGNSVGSSPYYKVGNAKHHINEFAVLVGDTSAGRKGTSWSDAKYLLTLADEEWAKDGIKTGLSSGEGLIHEVRDPVYKNEPVKDEKSKQIVRYESVMVDKGVEDKRRLIIEQEFTSPLILMSKPGNILSPVIRQAWDGGKLSPLIKNSPETATDHHISIIGHITKEELLRQFTETDKANGFGNRFLWFLIKKSKCLPEGGAVPEEVIFSLSDRLKNVINQCRGIGEMKRDDKARELWAKVYPALSNGKAGLTGVLLARAEAHVLRLSMIYALLDGSSIITTEHLKAALGVWDYVEKSAKLIFGKASGYSEVDKILLALEEKDLTETEIRDLFGKHNPKKVDRALIYISENLLAFKTKIETGGRPSTTWSLAT